MPQAEVSDVYLTAARNPQVTTRLMQRARREGMTIRQLHAAVSAGFWHLGVIGTPTDVADTMQTLVRTGRCRRLHHPAALSAWFGNGFR